MRLKIDPLLPLSGPQMLPQLYDLMRAIAKQVNALTEGSITVVTNAATAAPTTGTYQQGDQIRNKTPSELGTTGSKYVITGWVCTVAGTPGTWVAMRSLTGN